MKSLTRMPILTAAVVILASFAAEDTASAEDKATFDQAAATRGAILFKAHCAGCHGEEAKGDGSLAEVLKVKPANLTAISKKADFKFAQVVKTIDGRKRVKGHGIDKKSKMPAWYTSMLITGMAVDDADAKNKIREIAQYLWSIQAD